MNFSKVKERIKSGYPKGTERSMTYGTAGFRGPWNQLDWVMFRMGLLGVLRSKEQKGKAIGAMITASHNHIDDNGIKLIDPDGEMLEISWESFATDLINADDKDVVRVLEVIIKHFNIDVAVSAMIYMAQDTRPSSDALAAALRQGVEALGGSVRDFHLLTTPQLHYIVCAHNKLISRQTDQVDLSISDTAAQDEDCSEEGYYRKLIDNFIGLLKMKGEQGSEGDGYEAVIMVDGANGIGAVKLAELRSRFPGAADVTLPTVRIVNDGRGSGAVLNDGCGADFVKVSQQAPKPSTTWGTTKCASFDGDADRLVYFYHDADGRFHLLDGDKIAVLLTMFFAQLVRHSGLDLKIGVVQTAYANGASTKYITDVLNIPMACVKTGVKYLHEEAKKYDIGVYFEANGHGTVLFSPQAERRISKFLEECKANPKSGELSETLKSLHMDDGEEKKLEAPSLDIAMPFCDMDVQIAKEDVRNSWKAVEKLWLAGRLINQTVGDALSDLLLVEAVLFLENWSIQRWDAMYTDLPNRQLKVKVSDRQVVQTVDAERKCASPPGLQNAIDQSVKKYNSARAFVRPSGTEDVVRVYAEADTQENADRLAQEVVYHVFQLAGGVGPVPSRPS
ncbi:phosphoacetylglucosamine mutase-like [Paramacrobiotus metropolitanus]|uniref:phosphoacetylglucosamine mutase-like n=1 Tax=Paramacrobiotus metropolitanus TaxID=2943436 RepID=UPI0024462363|nr:phosphoacetylglucosamine mutase-like [Paramacrobiotus metropolitanus]XP_055327920.1 phosphoacetylglucosamine mutase-like [Paramacrobiotus metropolitanus]